MSKTPWHVKRVDNSTGDTLYLCHLFIEPDIAGLWAPPGNKEREAIAHKLAAAKEMYHACVLLVEGDMSSAIDVAMRALKKADGGNA